MTPGQLERRRAQASAMQRRYVSLDAPAVARPVPGMTPEARRDLRMQLADERFAIRQVIHGPPRVDASHLRGARWRTPWTYAESFNQPRGPQP